MKKFRSKRAMYEHISKEILQILGISRTATQCESRFKTIAKRKKTEDTNNRTSGHTHCQVSYEEEFAQIRAADDSIEPEVLRGVNSVTYKSAPKAAEQASTSADSAGASTSTSASTESPDHSSSEPLNDSTSEASENSGQQQRNKRQKDESNHPTAGRMRHMEYFFDRMEKLNQEREAKKDEREKRRSLS